MIGIRRKGLDGVHWLLGEQLVLVGASGVVGERLEMVGERLVLVGQRYWWGDWCWWESDWYYGSDWLLVPLAGRVIGIRARGDCLWWECDWYWWE